MPQVPRDRHYGFVKNGLPTGMSVNLQAPLPVTIVQFVGLLRPPFLNRTYPDFGSAGRKLTEDLLIIFSISRRRGRMPL